LENVKRAADIDSPSANRPSADGLGQEQCKFVPIGGLEVVLVDVAGGKEIEVNIPDRG